MNQTKDMEFLKHHFEDLDRRAFDKNYIIYSDFLNLNEMNILQRMQDGFHCFCTFFGGYENAERQMVSFQPEALSFTEDTLAFPLTCLKITPLQIRFAENLSHRDVLGAIMNLGFERNRIGDIIVQDSEIFVFCESKIQLYIQENLHKIKHTAIKIQECDFTTLNYQPAFKTFTSQIASNRLDAFIAESCHLSRQKAAEIILGEKVFINAMVVKNYSQKLNANDIISIRGYGKLIFNSFGSKTKSGKIHITYSWYI